MSLYEISDVSKYMRVSQRFNTDKFVISKGCVCYIGNLREISQVQQTSSCKLNRELSIDEWILLGSESDSVYSHTAEKLKILAVIFSL